MKQFRGRGLSGIIHPETRDLTPIEYLTLSRRAQIWRFTYEKFLRKIKKFPELDGTLLSLQIISSQLV